jgi:hypothetical protein
MLQSCHITRHAVCFCLPNRFSLALSNSLVLPLYVFVPPLCSRTFGYYHMLIHPFHMPTLRKHMPLVFTC